MAKDPNRRKKALSFTQGSQTRTADSELRIEGWEPLINSEEGDCYGAVVGSTYYRQNDKPSDDDARCFQMANGRWFVAQLGQRAEIFYNQRKPKGYPSPIIAIIVWKLRHG